MTKFIIENKHIKKGQLSDPILNFKYAFDATKK